MTRTYAAKRLLEHGPLDQRQFREITGWPKQVAWHVLQRMTLDGTLTILNLNGTRHFVLA